MTVSTIAQDIEKYFSKYPERRYTKGQILIFADENPEHIFYLLKGSVQEYDISYRGDEIVINTYNPPSFFPMAWAVNRKPNKYFYKTESETVLRVIPVDEALQFVKDEPEVLLDLMSHVYDSMDILLARLVHTMSDSARNRLLYELIIECHRSGKEVEKGEYILPFNETDLAARAGLSRETISREMQKLKTENLVSISSKGILVNDIESVEKKLHMD